MKPTPLSLPARDLGLPSVKPLALKLIDRLEDLERRLAQQEGAPLAPVNLAAERLLADRLEGHVGHTAIMERERVLHRATDEAYFREQLSQGRVHYTGTGAAAMNVNAPVMRLPAGALGTASVMVPARELWVLTRPTVTIWYTSPVANVAAFNLRFAVFTFGAGSTTTAPLLDVFWTPPGPAVANTVLTSKATITSGRFWSSPYGVAKLQLVRHQPGVDANPNDLDVLLAVCTFEEVA